MSITDGIDTVLDVHVLHDTTALDTDWVYKCNGSLFGILTKLTLTKFDIVALF